MQLTRVIQLGSVRAQFGGAPCVVSTDCPAHCTSRLRHERMVRGAALRAVARAVGTDPTHLLRVELGTEAAGDALKRRLAGHYATSVGRLFFSESEGGS